VGQPRELEDTFDGVPRESPVVFDVLFWELEKIPKFGVVEPETAIFQLLNF